jgi:hypothetical protein
MVEVFLSDGANWAKVAYTGIGEQHIDAALVSLYRIVEPLTISGDCDIALYAFRGRAKCVGRLVKLGLTPPRDVDKGAVLHVQFSGLKANPGTAASDDGNLAFK